MPLGHISFRNNEDIDTEDEWDELQEEMQNKEPLGQDEVLTTKQYEVDYPPLQTHESKKTEKWGPIQAPRASAINAGYSRTILQKAQQLKEAQDAATKKEQGKKSTPFSLFNNPHFISVASKIGIDIDSRDVNNLSLPFPRTLNPDRNVDPDSGFTTPLKDNIDDGVEHNSRFDFVGVWNLVCNHKRGKHPRTKVLP